MNMNTWVPPFSPSHCGLPLLPLPLALPHPTEEDLSLLIPQKAIFDLCLGWGFSVLI